MFLGVFANTLSTATAVHEGRRALNHPADGKVWCNGQPIRREACMRRMWSSRQSDDLAWRCHCSRRLIQPMGRTFYATFCQKLTTIHKTPDVPTRLALFTPRLGTAHSSLYA